MKKVLLLGSNNPGEKNDVTKVSAAVSPQLESDVEVRTAFWEDLLFEISQDKQSVTDTKQQTDIADADLVIAANWYRSGDQSIYRDAAYAAALYLDKKGVSFWNKEMVQQRSTTKLSATMQLALADHDVPHTLFSLDGNVLLSRAASVLLPAIVKDVAASRGRANYLVRDADKLKEHLSHGNLNRLMVQEFIPNQGDLRIVCFGGKPQLVIKRERRDTTTHLNNTSLGAEATLHDLKTLGEKTIAECEEICHLMGRDLAGIDLLVTDGENGRVVVLEANAIPQLTSGSFVDEKLNRLAEVIRDTLS